MKKISLVINTLNEENNIAACINSAAPFVDEIIVCDMHSDDQTVAIAKSLGATIVFHDRVGFVEPARFFAISQASHEWVLILDADEVMTKNLGNELVKIAHADLADLVQFSSLFNYFGKHIKYGGFFYNEWARFFKKEKYLETYSEKEEMVHNNFGNLKQKTKRKILLAKDFYIIHDAYPSFEKYLQKTLCNYSVIESNGLFKNGETVSFFKACVFPLKEFFMRYFIWQGFRDGKIGFIICYLKSQYTFYSLINLWFLLNDENNKK